MRAAQLHTPALVDDVLGANPNGPLALVDHSRPGPPRQWSYPELAAMVAGLAERLCAQGIRQGEVVAVLTENSAEFVVAYHGVLAAGAVVLPLDPRAPAETWARELASARHLVREPGLWPDTPATNVTVLTLPGEPPTAELPRFDGGDRPAVLLSSSGSTGIPKKVALTHRNLTGGLAQIRQVHRIEAGQAVLAVGPLRHIYGMQMALNPTLRARGTLVIGPARHNLAELLRVLADREVAIAYLVPSVLAEIAALDQVPPLPKLRLLVSGGAPLPGSTALAVRERLGIPVVQGYGMTEAGCISFTPDDRGGPVDAVGVVLPGTEARFVDPATGADVPGGPGELWLRGPQIAKAQAVDGWLRTGDLASQDAEGYLRITGRLKSLIKCKCHQIAPAELEGLLAEHPAVAEALVVGRPDRAAGEVPKAYVVLRDRTPLAEITAAVARKVAPHKRIRLIERVREIPRSGTGKPVEPQAPRILVTGGGRGLGREFAAALVTAGASVVITGRDREVLAATAADIGAKAVVADVNDPEAHRDAGEVDVLVHNAGVPGPLGPLWTVDHQEWRQAIEINLCGAASVARVVLPGMIARGHGRIITIASNAGRRGWPLVGGYAVSKAGLIALTANLNSELRGTGVNAIAYDPGLLDVGMTRAHLDRGVVGDPHADHVLAWTQRARREDRFASLPESVAALVAITTGAADHLAGRYVTAAHLAPRAD